MIRYTLNAVTFLVVVITIVYKCTLLSSSRTVFLFLFIVLVNAYNSLVKGMITKDVFSIDLQNVNKKKSLEIIFMRFTLPFPLHTLPPPSSQGDTSHPLQRNSRSFSYRLASSLLFDASGVSSVDNGGNPLKFLCILFNWDATATVSLLLENPVFWSWSFKFKGFLLCSLASMNCVRNCSACS